MTPLAQTQPPRARRVLLGLAALLAVLAATALRPTRHCCCGHGSQAINTLNKLFEASGAYFSTPRVDPATGKRLPCRFPPPNPITPPLGTPCCDEVADRSDSCFRAWRRPTPPSGDSAWFDAWAYAVAAGIWDTETWRALGFEARDVQRYRYAYQSGGTGNDAKFTVTAYGDVDCDGVWSTYERYGYGVAGPDGSCSIEGSSAFFKENENE